jgi:hypothetical protein
MATGDAPQEPRQKGFVVPWGWLSLCLSILSITALGTLAVVAKKQSADTLSTIALALAILSFSAQLIIALAQAYNGVLQVSQAGQINTDTRSSLAEIRATSNALLSTQRDQFSIVLQAALSAAIPAAVEDVISKDDREDVDQAETDRASKDLEERLFVRLNEALSTQRSPSKLPNLRTNRKPSPIYERLITYPVEQRGKELLSILDGLSAQDAALFSRSATLIRDRAQRGDRRPSVLLRMAGKGNATKRLIDLGLITVTDAPPSVDGAPRSRVELTDLGIEVSSLILGLGEMPSWLVKSLDN